MAEKALEPDRPGIKSATFLLCDIGQVTNISELGVALKHCSSAIDFVGIL